MRFVAGLHATYVANGSPPARGASALAHQPHGVAERYARDARIGGEPDDRRAAPVEVVDLPEPDGRVHGEAVLLAGLEGEEASFGVRRAPLDALDHLRELPPCDRGGVGPRDVEHRDTP